jgi:hypothetical protein
MAGMQIAQMIAQGAGNIMSAWAQSETAKDEAKILSANADIARATARNKAAQEREKYARIAGSQRAQYGASGVDVNTGSPLGVIADTDAEGEVSAMQLLYGGELEGWGYDRQAKIKRHEGKSMLMRTLIDPLGWMLKTPNGSGGTTGILSGGGGGGGSWTGDNASGLSKFVKGGGGSAVDALKMY